LADVERSVAVLVGMGLAMVERPYLRIANALLAGLVLSEPVATTTRASGRRGAVSASG